MSQEIKKQKEERSNIIDAVLLILLSGLCTIVAMPEFSISFDDNIRFAVDWLHYPPSWFSYPAILIFLLFCILFYIRIKKKTPFNVNKVWITIFSLLILFRFIGCFAFPYGPHQYSVEYDNQIYSVYYSGFSLHDRILSFGFEACFAVYLYILFSVVPVLAPSLQKVLRYMDWIMIAVGIIAIIYSFIFEGNFINNNFHTIFDGSKEPYTGIRSFTGHRNVFGFLLMMSGFGSMLLFIRKQNPLYPIFYLFFLFFSFLIYSRTAFVILSVSFVVMVLLYPILEWKTHPKSSKIMMTLLSVFLIGAICLFIFGQNIRLIHSLTQSIQNYFSKTGTIFTRNIHSLITIKMMEINPFYFIFGFGKLPFTDIYLNMEQQIIPNDVVYNAHNSYLQQWVTLGLPVLILTLVGFGYLIYHIFRLMKKGNRFSTYLLVLMVALGLYSVMEPRMLFLMMESIIYFIVALFLPIESWYHEAYHKEENHHDLLTYHLL